MDIHEYHRGEYTISTDPARLDPRKVHEMLTQLTYWAQNRTLDVVERAIAHSLNFGVYHNGAQVGYARVVTDYATFAWLCDVIIEPDHRKGGLGKWLVECFVNHPEIKTLRRLLLATRDAHELYRKYGGFTELPNPERWMERFNPDA